MPTVDLNAVLVAIRIASYGHNMEIVSTCPECSTDSDYSLDLRTVLDKLKSGDFRQEIKHGDLSIAFRPMTYEHQNTSNQNQFEQQKRIQVVQASDLTDAEKITELNNSLQKITELTMEALKWSIASIRTPQTLVTEPEYIHEFLTNCDRKLYTEIKDHIINLRESSEIKPLIIKCSECSHEYRQQISLDQAAFFVAAS
jgi:RNase P subunit RPR2